MRMPVTVKETPLSPVPLNTLFDADPPLMAAALSVKVFSTLRWMVAFN